MKYKLIEMDEFKSLVTEDLWAVLGVINDGTVSLEFNDVVVQVIGKETIIEIDYGGVMTAIRADDIISIYTMDKAEICTFTMVLPSGYLRFYKLDI